MLATFAIGTDSFVIAGILPQVAQSLEVSVGSAGQLVTAYALTYALLSPVVAVVAARWSRDRLLLVGLSLFVIANIGTALAPTFGLVILCRILAGLGGAAVTPVAVATGASLVPEERRGTALAVVGGGIAVSSALGVPLGAVIGSLSDWHATMWFVAALGVVAAIGIIALVPNRPAPPPIGLRQRLAPIGNSRIALTLATTLFAFTGNFILNTYVSQTFMGATGGHGTTLALLLFLAGAAGVVGNLGSGPLTDRWGNRTVFNIAAAITMVDFALTPWTGEYLAAAVFAVLVWGVAGMAQLVPQQDRLIGISPESAPLAIALNSSVVFIGASLSGVIGAVGLNLVGARYLGVIGAVLFAVSLVFAHLAYLSIKRAQPLPQVVKP
ncbi:MFS transporter [Actinomadura craniellae]|nr:MFS transporter [Actinomadura craniellae]